MALQVMLQFEIYFSESKFDFKFDIMDSDGGIFLRETFIRNCTELTFLFDMPTHLQKLKWGGKVLLSEAIIIIIRLGRNVALNIST